MVLEDVQAVVCLMQAWEQQQQQQQDSLPLWAYREAWCDWRRWRQDRWRRILTRAQSSAWVDVDTSMDACLRASMLLGLRQPLLAGDRVRMTRRCGKVLEAPEGRVVLGAYRGLLWYETLDSPREGNAGGGAGEGGGGVACWFWQPCDVDGLEVVGRARRGVVRRLVAAAAAAVAGAGAGAAVALPVLPSLPLLPMFQGGQLRVVFDQAVVREGLEIDTSEKLGEVEQDALLEATERRVNSSNIARFKIDFHGMEGWISEKIRGEREDLIVRRVPKEGEEEGRGEGGLRLEERLRVAVREWNREVVALVLAVGGGEGAAAAAAAAAAGQHQTMVDADTMETDTPSSSSLPPSSSLPSSSSLDPEVVWCGNEDVELAAAEEAAAAGATSSFAAFERLARVMKEGEGGQQQQQQQGWTLEADEQLTQLLNEAATTQGETLPLNMSYHQLSLLLHQIHQEEKEAATEGAGAALLAQGRGLLSDKPALRGIAPERLLARASLLRVFNQRLTRALPLLSLALPEVEWQKEQIGYSDPIPVETTYPPSSSSSSSASAAGVWRPACTARRLRSLRKLILTHTKRAHWEGMLQATTTPTPLHQDEYEDPREIKTIKINRVRASASRLASIRNMNERLRLSVFGQLHKEMRAWSHSAFRRAYLGKGHGGQKRAFKVRFLGEGVNDYGGPYRAVFEQVADELQDDRHLLPLAAPSPHRPGGEKCLLPLLVPCPNRTGAVGPNQDKFVLSPGLPSPLALELMQLLGKMVGMALRHGLPMGLDLPSTVWRPLVGLPLKRNALESLDFLAVRNLEQVEQTALAAEAKAARAGRGGREGGQGGGKEGGSNSLVPEGWEEELTFTTHLSDGSLVALPYAPPSSPAAPQQQQQQPQRVTRANWREYVRLVETVRLKESSAMLGAFQDGLASVLPQELLPLFTEDEVERLICGVREVDVDLLKQCTDYEEGTEAGQAHIQAFWEVLREMTPEERTDFLRFTWARSRMPASAKDFPMNFRLQGPQGGAKEKPDDYLPHAQTCFFSLSLPQYSTKEILRAKLLLAISNSPNMDADVRLHTAEGWAET